MPQKAKKEPPKPQPKQSDRKAKLLKQNQEIADKIKQLQQGILTIQQKANAEINELRQAITGLSQLHISNHGKIELLEELEKEKGKVASN